MAPGISVREHIRWQDGPADEDTLTVVLTAPSSHFVDGRVLKKQPGKASETWDIQPEQLDWAFAGTVETKPSQKNEWHSVWKHWVDSRTLDPDSVVDKGNTREIEPRFTVENGNMVNPQSGKMENYEERWREEEVLATADHAVKKGPPEPFKRFSVLQYQEDASQTRGMAVRVGQYCQCIMRVGAETSFQRWEWKAERGWLLAIRMGSMIMPCSKMIGSPDRLEPGSDVLCGDLKWRVESCGILDPK